MKELSALIQEQFGGGEQDANAYSPLALAFLGDAVYELVIRTVIIGKGNRPANDLNTMTVRFVRAGAQAQMIESLLPELTEEEEAVYKRGRNAKASTSAKNASIQDYRKATGLEALVGYLYLQQNTARILELLSKGYTNLTKEK